MHGCFHLAQVGESWLCPPDYAIQTFLVTVAQSNKQTFTEGIVNGIGISRSVEQHMTINV